MRTLGWALVLLVTGCLLAAPAGAGDLPYTGYINADGVNVRSGPGDNYYAVTRLNRGQTVEVWRHDPGGWIAIRPTPDSFSWVSAEFVERRSETRGVITGDRVVARVGSVYTDIRDVIQVRLDRGEEVHILDTHRFTSSAGGQTWYRIAPPSGEFRWVSARFVDQDPPYTPRTESDDHNYLRQASAARRAAQARRLDEDFDDNPLLDRLRERRPQAAENDDYEVDDAPARHTLRNHPRYSPAPARRAIVVPEDTPQHDIAARRHSSADMATYDDNQPHQFQPPVRIAFANSPVPRRAAPAEPVTPVEPVASDVVTITARGVEDLELALSARVLEDPDRWDFADIRAQADALIDEAETAVQRGQVRKFLQKLERLETLASHTPATSRERLAAAPSAGAAARQQIVEPTSTDDPRFDGTGKLAQVVTRDPGTPGFALLNHDGTIRYYVTPAPGVSLRPYLGREVGLTGSLGYLSQQDSQHVTAKRITVLR